MKTMMLVLTLPLALLMTGCHPYTVKQSAVSAATASVGCYRSDDASGYNVLRLRLKPDMTYKAVIWGDIGPWGSAAGNWRIEDNSVLLLPTMEKGSMKGFTGPLAAHEILRGRSLDLSTSINKQNAKLGWAGWSLLMPTACKAQYQDEALNPS